jgi:RNA polymerase sigma factor (sigma-70 family)
LLLSEFTEEEQQLVDLRLQQCTNEEAAARMGCSERTVRRILNRIKDRLKHVFETS